MSRRAISGGFDNHPPATRSSYALRDLNSFPPSGAIFKPFDLAEPSPNKFSLFEGFSISFVSGAVFIAAAVFLFVEF